MNTRSRRIIIILSALLFVGSIVGYQLLSKQKTPPPRNLSNGTALITLQAAPANTGTLTVPIPLQGRIAAYEKIDLFAEVNGLFLGSAHPFKEGVRFQKGQELVRLEDREARLSLHAQRAAFLTSLAQILPDIRIDFSDRFPIWEEYIRQLHPEKTLKDLPEPASDRERYFLASRNIQGQFYTIRSSEERLTKFRILAPFHGTLTNVEVQTGGLVRPGQRLGSFMRLGAYELETTISLNDLPFLRQGQAVTLKSEDTGETYKGTVSRIGDQIDPGTQMAPVYITVNGPTLKEGMFLSGTISGLPESQVLALPKELLINGTSVWSIGDSTLFLMPVQLVRSNREEVILRGIPQGALLVRKVIPGMFEGMKVSWTTS